MNKHMHKYKFECFEKNKHAHKISGCTEGTIGIPSLHFHYFSGISSYNGHTHYFSGFTGFPISTEYGHIHHIDGFLEPTGEHEHTFRSFTFEEIEYIAKKFFKTAIV